MGYTYACVVAVLILAAGCGGEVQSRYETRSDAEAGRMFDRGWLPRAIPASSRGIVTTNHLDLNLSEGAFSFEPNEANGFLERLQRMEAAEVSGTDQVKFLERGYWPYAYEEGGSRWVFFVNGAEGHCEYRMGRHR